MAISVTNNEGFTIPGNNAAPVITPGFTATAGQVLVLQLMGPTTCANINSVVCTNVTWTLRINGSTQRKNRVYEGLVTGVPGADITINMADGVSPGQYQANLIAISGLPTGGGAQAGASSTTNGTSPPAIAGPVTPTATRNVILLASVAYNAGVGADPAGLTLLSNSTNGVRFYYRIESSASGAYDAQLTFTSGVWAAQIITFMADLPTASLAMVTEPTCALSGQASTPVQVEYRTAGVRDTSFNGNITAVKQTGSGSSAGSTLTVACVNGLATFTNLRITGSDAHTWRFSESVSGATVDSTTQYIRETPYSVLGAFGANVDIIDSWSSAQGSPVRTRSRMFVPAAANAGTPLPIYVYGHGSSGYENPNTPIGSETFGTTVTALAASFSSFALFPSISNSTNANLVGGEMGKKAWRRAIKEIILRAIQDGYNIDLNRIYYYGFSTGGIQLIFLAAEYPDFYAALGCSDLTFHSGVATNNGAGGPYAALAAGFYDPNINNPAYVGPPAVDGLALAEAGRVFYATNIALFINHGTEVNGSPNWPRNILDPVPIIDGIDAAGGPSTVTRLSTSSTTAPAGLIPSVKRAYIAWGASVSHSQLEARVVSTANWPTVDAWYRGQTKPTGGGGAGTVTPSVITNYNPTPVGIQQQKITPGNPLRFGVAPIDFSFGTSTGLTAQIMDAMLPGFAFEVERVEVFATAVTATITVDVQIGSTSVLSGAITPVALTRVAGTMATSKAARRGSATQDINVKLTTNGTGAATNLKVRVWARPFPINTEAAP